MNAHIYQRLRQRIGQPHTTAQESLIEAAGDAPYTRGPYASMYVGRPWTIRQYAGFSTAQESNQFYRKNLAAGQKGLSVAFDLATHRGYDSDHPRVAGDVGMAGVAIDSVQDMKRLFEGIPLDQMSVSMTMNGAVIPIMAFYIIAAEEQGVPTQALSGTIQNDILKEFMVRNTYIYPPAPSMRIVSDIFQYTSTYMPRFNSISVSGYHMQEAGAPPAMELAYTIANGLAYIEAGLKAGLKVDDFAPRISFFWGIGMNLMDEIAKLRAARYIWAQKVKEMFGASTRSQSLRAHSQTSGWSLTEQDPLNNITRTTIEAMAATLGGTQSLHTNSYDEAIALPTERSARVARETQLYLQRHAGITTMVDPMAGSHELNRRIRQMYLQVEKYLNEIEEVGGMIKALEMGLPKMRIEEAATLRQAGIENGAYPIIGVNQLRTSSTYDVDTLAIDNAAVLAEQVANLKQLRSSRDDTRVEQCLAQIRACASDARNGNILSAAIDAARARATLGEISSAMESVFGRYQAQTVSVSGVYSRAMKDNEAYQAVIAKCDDFAHRHGRRPRIMIAKLGQDGHDRGAKIIATSFADMGFDVDIGPLFQTPMEAVRQAVEHDVHILGISSLAAGHKRLVPEVISLLHDMNADDIMVIVGGVIPVKDYDYLYAAGVSGIFGPGTSITQAAMTLLEKLEEK